MKLMETIMLKEKQTDIVLTNEEEIKFKNIELYKKAYQAEVDAVKKEVKEKVEEELALLEKTKDMNRFKESILPLCCTKYGSLFETYLFPFSSMKKYKEYIKGNIFIAIPVSLFSVLLGSNGGLLNLLLAIGWLFVVGGALLGASFLEYKNEDKKKLKILNKAMYERIEQSSYENSIRAYVDQKSISLENMRLIKKIFNEEIIKEILYKSKGNPTYDDFAYILKAEKNSIENKVLKKNIDKIYLNI